MFDPREADGPLIEAERGEDGRYAVTPELPWWTELMLAQRLMGLVFALGLLSPFVQIGLWLVSD